MTNREKLCELVYEDLMVFENPDYDSAIVGVSECGRVIYDYDEMIACLMKNENMDEMDAADFISYNTIRSLPYAGSSGPIVMYGLVDF